MSDITSEKPESTMNTGIATRRPAKGPRVAVAQIEPALGNVEANLEKHREAVERAKEVGADLLVFPELSMTGYRLKDEVPDVAATENGPLFEMLAEMSADVSLLVGLVTEARNFSFYNSAAYFEGGRRRAMHNKVYLPTYGMFDEQRYFARGDRIRAFDTQLGRMGILICEDMLHPSAMMIAALDGAGVLLVPSASPSRGVSAAGEVDANGRHWESYNRTMARNFGLFIVHANRVGVEDGQTFWGGSEIVGPDGETLAKAAYYEPDFISATLPLEAMRRRRIQAPVLRDENVDLTINELCRVRERPAPQLEERGAPPRPAWRDDRRGAGGDDRRRAGGDDRRGAPRDDRRGPPRDDRRGPPRDDRRGAPRDDRRGAPRDDRRGAPRDDARGPERERWRGAGREDRRGPGREQRPFAERDDRRQSSDPRFTRGASAGAAPRGPQHQDVASDETDVPARLRPERGARKPRPVGASGRRRDDPKPRG